MKKRIIAVILCVVMITSCLQSLKNIRVCADEVTTNFVEIQHNLVKTNAFSLAKDSKTKLTAVTDIASPTYRWQIMMPKYGNIWVDIMNENEAELEVSYALCSNALLNESAYLRVVASNESNELYSTAVVVTFTDYELSDTIEVEGGEMTELYSEGVDLLITPEPTPEITPDVTPEPTLEPTPEVTPEITPEPTLEPTPEITPDVTPEPTPEITPDVTPEPTATPIPTATPTPEPTATPIPTATPTPEITATPIPTATPTPEITPDTTPEPTPEITPDATPEPTPEITPDATPEPTPEITPDATPEPTPEITPDATPEPTPEITPDATPEPTPEITPDVTPEPAPEITPDATPEPTPEITPEPNGEGGNGSQSTGTSEAFAGRILRSTTPDPDPSGEEDYVYVTVEYLNEEGNKLFQPFTAQLQKGSSFSYDVYCPSYVGYAPYKVISKSGDTYVTEENPVQLISFNQTVSSDINITIIYKPQKVSYSVHVMFQKTNSDEYEEDASASFTGYEYTGVTLTDEQLLSNVPASKLIGFKALYHYPDSVAADGSTEIYFYFDRIYNLIKFDLDGGYGMEPQYGRYGSNFIVNTPTKPGYSFDKWELVLDEEILQDFSQDTNGYYYQEDEHGNKIYYNGTNGYKNLPSTVPPIPLAFKAKWKTTDTNFKVIFWAENVNDNNYSYWTQKTVSAQSTTIVNGETYKSLPVGTEDVDGFEFDHADTGVLVEGNGSTIVNVYYRRKYFTLSFYDDDVKKCLLPEHTHDLDCYTMICSKDEHTHDASCGLICTLTEHLAHTAECCSLTEYQHDYRTDYNCYKHTYSCYGVTNTTTDILSSAPNNPAQGQIYYSSYYKRYYVYVGNRWYRYPYSAANISIVYPTACSGNCTLNCTNPEHHSHQDGNCVYTNESCKYGGLHQHTDSCYSCNKQAHVHNDTCKRLNCSIAEHSHSNANCRYVVEHTWGSDDIYYKVFEVQRKFGADISDIWPIKKADGSGDYKSSRWSPVNSSEIIFFMQNMPAQNKQFIPASKTLFEHETNVNYFVETINHTGETDYNGHNYDLMMSCVSEIGLSYSSQEYSFPIDGFVFSVQNSIKDKYNLYTVELDLYYNRLSFEVTLSDGFNSSSSYSVKYDELINSAISGGIRNYIPPYPTEALEENAYTFGGWFTTSDCIPGSEFDPTMTMPSHDVVLTAKWVPLSHTVNFFKTYDQMVEYEESLGTASPKTNLIYHTETVAHGNVVGTVTEPTDDWSGTSNYHFANWFYDLFGETSAYLPAEMPINRDMNVYADWGSDKAQPYAIHYVLVDPVNATVAAQITATCGTPEYGHTYSYNSKKYYYDGTDYYEKVAEDTTGYAFEGTNRTFKAKTGQSGPGATDNQLYSGYATGYFPTVASHALRIKAETNDAYPVQNSYMFTYAYFTGPITYEIRHVDKNNLSNELCTTYQESDHLKTTQYSVVEERFKPISQYVPDAFYKRLVLTVVKNENGEWVSSPDNVMYFLYSKGGNASLYAIHFMLQDIDSDTYTESEVRVEGSADIGENKLKFAPLEFDGFTVIDKANVFYGPGASVNYCLMTHTGEDAGKFVCDIDAAGTDLYIYYTRNSYPYYVYYLLANTPFTPETISTISNDYIVKKDGTNKYVTNGTAQFDKLVSYTCEDDVPGYSLVSENPTKSISIRQDSNGVCQNIIVFYFSPEQYMIQYTAGKGGKVSNGNVTGTLEIVKGTSVTATADEGYYFAGWYMDEECTVPLTVKSGSDTNPATGSSTITASGWEQVASMVTLSNTNYTDSGLTSYVKKSVLTPTGNGLVKNSSLNTIYAKFIPLKSSLKIERTDADDETQPFIYRIQSLDNDNVDMFVVIIGNDSVIVTDLLLGDYKITEITDWSFRYDSEVNPAETVTVVMNSVNSATFSDEVNTVSWLTDTDYTKNSKR